MADTKICANVRYMLIWLQTVEPVSFNSILVACNSAFVSDPGYMHGDLFQVSTQPDGRSRHYASRGDMQVLCFRKLLDHRQEASRQ